MSSTLKKILTIAIAIVVVGCGAFFFGTQLKATDDNSEYADAPKGEVAVEEIVIEMPTELSEEIVVEEETTIAPEEAVIPEVTESETIKEPETEAITEPETETTVEPETEKAEEKPTVAKKIEIWTDRGPVLNDGDIIHLYSKLTGFDGEEVKYQWQCNKGDGYKDVAGATESTYSYSASKESLKWSWRLMVNY